MVRVARAAYPKGNVSTQMRDALGPIYQDESFAHLYPHNGRPVEAPWRLALITIMQFAEELHDREAADAVGGRIDWTAKDEGRSHPDKKRMAPGEQTEEPS